LLSQEWRKITEADGWGVVVGWGIIAWPWLWFAGPWPMLSRLRFGEDLLLMQDKYDFEAGLQHEKGCSTALLSN
jgi:hypothetical protein